MLKNPNVMKVCLNTERGLCQIFMDNGEQFQCDDIFYPEDLREYINMLKVEDEMHFMHQTIWQLITDDNWEEWKPLFECLGVLHVMITNLKGVVQEMKLKEMD